MEMGMRFYRKWHRLVGWTTAIFLIWAASTGVVVAFSEFFGEEETERERLRDVTSAVTLTSPDSAYAAPLGRAIAAANAKVPGAPVDKIELRLKGDTPEIRIFLGKPGGGEDRLLRYGATTGALIAEEAYVDKPLLWRLHSGEAFGDGGLVVAMLWGLALAVMGVSGVLMYLHMLKRRQVTGWRRYFW